MNWMDEELASIVPGLRRRLRVMQYGCDAIVEKDGRRLINFTSNNYLSLARHPFVVEEATRAIREDGAGAGSSRLITGTTPRIVALEESLADLKRTPRAIVTPSGFMAALAAVSIMVSRQDGIALERGAHSSLVSASRLSGAAISVFRRDDASSLERCLLRLKKRVRRTLVVLDGIHSMDGDIAPLPSILPIVERHEAMLLIDDAHATGVIGDQGSGTLSHFGMQPGNYVVQMGTLSKALGSQGGFIAGPRGLIDLITQKSTAFIYTTALAPACVGAALGALAVLRHEPDRLEKLHENALALRKQIGLDETLIGPHTAGSPIVPMIVGTPEAALEAARRLEDRGALAVAIRPPTVPRGTSRLRLSVQADHVIPDGLFRE